MALAPTTLVVEGLALDSLAGGCGCVLCAKCSDSNSSSSGCASGNSSGTSSGDKR